MPYVDERRREKLAEFSERKRPRGEFGDAGFSAEDEVGNVAADPPKSRLVYDQTGHQIIAFSQIGDMHT